MSTRVLLADDHPAFALGMRLALQDHGFEVIGTAATGLAALNLNDELSPDVAILDVRMPGGTGIDVSRRLTATSPGLLVVVLSTYDDAATVQSARDAGARAYFTKETPIQVIADSIRRLLAEPTLNLIAPPALPRLTVRELDVLVAMGEGMTNKQIAVRLGVGVETVKDHCSAIFGKLSVRDRVTAILEARRLGFLQR